VIDAAFAGAWELPAIGAVTAAAAVLIRPDGHVAWTGDGTDRGLAEALALGSERPAGDPEKHALGEGRGRLHFSDKTTRQNTDADST
jgi:hypothetical protein